MLNIRGEIFILVLAKMSPAPLVNYNGTIQQDLVDILLQIQHLVPHFAETSAGARM